MDYLFWICVALVLYVYLGYPAIIGLAEANWGNAVTKNEIQPSITILIPAFNEADHIAATIDNKLGLAYPKELLEIIVVSDNSSDGTDEIVRSYAALGVRLIRQEPRQGKTSGLNLAVPHTRGEIIVFSDANSLYAPDALRKLAANFADSSVGYVTGKMVYANADGSIVGDGCSAYMRYENWLRRKESSLGSVVGVDGGIDAVRKSLYYPMRNDQLPDFVLPLSVAKQGYRVVYEEEALLKENALSTSEAEYRMRVRVSLRALWALYDMRSLLNPVRYPLYAWQLWSHKVLRYLAFAPLMGAFAANVVLSFHSRFYALMLVLQVGLYILAGVGWLVRHRASQPVWLTFPYFFVLINAACLHAVWRFLRGQKQAIWNPRLG